MSDQAWFWTPEWQAGERQADADIAAGRVYPADPCDQCLAVDPPTGQPDHEHGDACENPDCS